MMKTTKLMGLTLLGSASLIAAAAIAEPVADGGRKFTTTMTGALECNASGACNLGDPDGSGTARITVNIGQKRVCYELRVSGIVPATAAHIHLAPAGVAGPVGVPLGAPSDGDSSGCVAVTAELAKNILKNPAAYYVNVHNVDFPAGAVRGQLGK
jgi:CHRD domain